METNQITNNRINQYLFVEKDQAIENKVKSIVSQLPGKVRNITFQYNKKSIAKARITVVVASKEDALKVRQTIDDEIDIKVIISDGLKDQKITPKDNTIKNNQDLVTVEQNIYTYNRGPDGKIYGIIKKENKKTIDPYIPQSKDISINNNLRYKYINIYKRYNFKNIKIQKNIFSVDI